MLRIPNPARAQASLDTLNASQSLIVQQQKEWVEILLGFETRNRYAVLDQVGQRLFWAAEVEGSVLARNFLGGARPFTIHILTLDGELLLVLKRRFRFLFHRMDVFDMSEAPLGAIQARFAILRRVYSILDSSGQEIFRLIGPVFHPWTFEVQKDGRRIGEIVKKWSGLLKEIFTDADNFGVNFPVEFGEVQKCLLLGAVFLIDFVHFEDAGAVGDVVDYADDIFD